MEGSELGFLRCGGVLKLGFDFAGEVLQLPGADEGESLGAGGRVYLLKDAPDGSVEVAVGFLISKPGLFKKGLENFGVVASFMESEGEVVRVPELDEEGETSGFLTLSELTDDVDCFAASCFREDGGEVIRVVSEGDFAFLKGGEPSGPKGADGEGEGVVEVAICRMLERESGDFERLWGSDFGTGEDGLHADARVLVTCGPGEELEWLFEVTVPAADEASSDGANARFVELDHGGDELGPRGFVSGEDTTDFVDEVW